MNHIPSNTLAGKPVFAKPKNISELRVSIAAMLRQLGFKVKMDVSDDVDRAEESHAVQPDSQAELATRTSIELSFDDAEFDTLSCVLKPQEFHPQEQSVQAENLRKVTVGELTIDQLQRVCIVSGKEIDLTTGEFDLLWLLAVQAGKVVSRKDLFRNLMDFDPDPSDRSIDLRVSRLRKKLECDSIKTPRIKSIRGVGYLLANPQS